VATGIMSGFTFHFLPDRRILLTERPGRLRVVGTDGRVSDPIKRVPSIYAGGPQGLSDALPDVAFSHNRVVYLTYTARPSDDTAAPAPRLAGHLMVARARLSADMMALEDVKVLLDGEGIGGRVIRAPDGSLLITSSIPAGVGINSEDWPQPQQLDSLMGKVLRTATHAVR
jgi:glucose/arabinose dehydrogenase